MRGTNTAPRHEFCLEVEHVVEAVQSVRNRGAALVVIASLATPALGLAAGLPNAPLAVSNEMRHLEVGGQDWYAFTTAGADRNDDPSHVLIILVCGCPTAARRFKVWTAEGLRQKATEDPAHPVYAMGEGTKLEYQDGSQTLDRYSGDLVWHNGFKVGGTFYVQVGQIGSQASNYRLTITGDNISFPAGTSTSAAATSAAQVAPAVTNRDIPAEQAPGSGMGTAMTPTGQTKTLNPGGQQWYAVTVGRPIKDEDKQNLNVELAAGPGAPSSPSGPQKGWPNAPPAPIPTRTRRPSGKAPRRPIETATRRWNAITVI